MIDHQQTAKKANLDLLVVVLLALRQRLQQRQSRRLADAARRRVEALADHLIDCFFFHNLFLAEQNLHRLAAMLASNMPTRLSLQAAAIRAVAAMKTGIVPLNYAKSHRRLKYSTHGLESRWFLAWTVLLSRVSATSVLHSKQGILSLVSVANDVTSGKHCFFIRCTSCSMPGVGK